MVPLPIRIKNEKTGQDIELKFYEWLNPGVHTVVLINHTTGEVREQALKHWTRFSKQWRKVAERHMRRDDPDMITPGVCIPSGWPPSDG